MENTKEYKISDHCKRRYAERIMDKDGTGDVNRFIFANEDKIKTDIHKMIHYGNLIHSGVQSKTDGKGKVIDVYLKDTWVILVDNQSDVVVTLFKVDLGLDDEFNKAYISKMLEKLEESKKSLEEIKLATHQESEMYYSLIEDSESQIKEYKSMIRNLEELITGYKIITDNNGVKVVQAEKGVADVINTLIGKKEF